MELKNLKTLNVLSILLAIGVIISASAGVFLPDTYEREVPSMAAQGIGQDFVDLFIVVPVLLISLYYTNKNSRRATLILGGTIAYLMYSYVIYSLGINFNRFFLVYTLTFGLGLYAFIIFMNDIFKHPVHEWFNKPPRKLIGIYFLVVAAIFYFLWLSSIIPAMINNTVPKDVADYNLLVNPVHVLDIAFALPALILGSIKLIQGKKTGYIIASLALVFMILLTLALAGMVIAIVIEDISEDFTIATVFGVLTITSLAFLILFFKELKK